MPKISANGRFATALFLLCALLLSGPPVRAQEQSETGKLYGTVTDLQGGPLPGATVSLLGPGASRRVTTTDSNGAFRFEGIPAGDYGLNTELEGFKRDRMSVEVRKQRTTTVEVALELDAVGEEIVVSGKQSSVSEAPTDPYTYTREEVEGLPIVRPLWNVVTLIPGVEAGPGLVTNGGPQIPGGFSYDNIFLLNGVDIGHESYGGQLPLFVEEAIDDVQVLTSGWTHLFVGGNGVHPVDLSGFSPGVKAPVETTRDVDGPTYAVRLDARHPFAASFYVSGLYSYVNGGFQPVPGGGTDPAAPSDIDGDGRPDSFFVQVSDLCRDGDGDVYSSFLSVDRTGDGGGTLKPDPAVQPPDCDRSRGSYRDEVLDLRFGQDRQFTANLSGILSRDAFNVTNEWQNRPWVSGSYRIQDPDDGDDDPETTEGINTFRFEANPPGERRDPFDLKVDDYTGALTPNLFVEGEYSGRDFTLGPVFDAALARGIQDVGVEFGTDIDEEILFHGDERYAPGGAIVEDDVPPVLYFVAKGGSTGEVFDVEIVHPAGEAAPFRGLVAIEPVAATAADRARFEEELAKIGGIRETVTAAGYCLQFAADAPPAGTVFRVAGRAKQEAFAPKARALAAARSLYEAGLLNPDTGPEGYFHSIRQWSVWTMERGFDAEGFVDAFLEHTRKNVEAAGREWTDEIAGIARTSAEGRWRDISRVLEQANR